MPLYPYETDRTLDGRTALTKGTSVRLRSGPGTSNPVLVTVAASGSRAGTLTGRYTVDGPYRWYEMENTPAGRNAWIRNDLAAITGPNATISTSSDAEAQKILDEIIAQDKETMNNLNQVAGMIEALKAKGVNTITSASKLTVIAARLQQRQDNLQKSSLVKVKDRISDGWSAVKKFFGFSGLGVVPIVVVAVAVVAGAGATALITLKPWKNQSTIDLRESKELKNLLDAADPVVAGKIREDLKNQVVDAYNTGNRQGSFGSTFKIVGLIGAAILGYWGIQMLTGKK